jgi:5-methyltetrahydrofolate--homocysteine methyltransferase
MNYSPKKILFKLFWGKKGVIDHPWIVFMENYICSYRHDPFSSDTKRSSPSIFLPAQKPFIGKIIRFSMTTTIFENIAQAVIDGDAPQVKQLTEEGLNQEIPPIDIINKGLIKGMDVVGEQFRMMEISVPEVLISARAMLTSMELLKPLLLQHDVKPKGIMILGTVKGDIHDIGKNLVAMLMEGAGFEVIDLGVDVSPLQFVEKIKESNPDIVGLSALLTITMQEMPEIIKAIEKAGLRAEVKIMVGGAPVTQEFCDSIGADAYGEDARDAVEKAQSLLGIG